MKPQRILYVFITISVQKCCPKACKILDCFRKIYQQTNFVKQVEKHSLAHVINCCDLRDENHTQFMAMPPLLLEFNVLADDFASS